MKLINYIFLSLFLELNAAIACIHTIELLYTPRRCEARENQKSEHHRTLPRMIYIFCNECECRIREMLIIQSGVLGRLNSLVWNKFYLNLMRRKKNFALKCNW